MQTIFEFRMDETIFVAVKNLKKISGKILLTSQIQKLKKYKLNEKLKIPKILKPMFVS